MTISVGDTLPDATFKIITADGPANTTVAEVFGGKTVVLFGVPGAFTPTCSMNHLPGFIENNDAIRAKGVDTIAVVSVNDHHVMRAWEKSAGAEGKIQFLADANADFVKAIGLDIDLGAGGLGIRSKRFSMIVDDRKVRALNIEDSPGKAVESGAARLLEQL